MIIAIYEKRRQCSKISEKIREITFYKKRMFAKKVQYESGYNKIIKNLANTNLLLHFLFNFGALWNI